MQSGTENLSQQHLSVTTLILVYRGGSLAYSGNGVGRIDEVTLRRARLVPGWVTVFGRTNHHGM